MRVCVFGGDLVRVCVQAGCAHTRLGVCFAYLLVALCLGSHTFLSGICAPVPCALDMGSASSEPRLAEAVVCALRGSPASTAAGPPLLLCLHPPP